jgi:hypothetical protein
MNPLSRLSKSLSKSLSRPSNDKESTQQQSLLSALPANSNGNGNGNGNCNDNGNGNPHKPCNPHEPCNPHKSCPSPCVPPSPAIVRQNEAYYIRVKAAYKEFLRPLPDHPTNGDEALYPNRIANFSKALPHDTLGVVDPTAYDSMLFALQTQDPSNFDEIPMGSMPSVKLTDPQAAYAFDLEGADSSSLAISPAPTFASAQQASETVELYNMALMRDVNFDKYDTSPLTTNAVIYLNACSDFRGPKIGGQVTQSTLFRGNLTGSLNGPFLSQYLYQPFAYGALSIVQKSRETSVNSDYLYTLTSWLQVQNGTPVPQPTFPNARHIINARDLAEYVHVDALYEPYLNALLYLLGIGTPLNSGNPYIKNPSQVGFGTFGGAHILSLLAEVSNRAIKAAWSQKWLHRRCRPEAFCNRVDLTKTNQATDPIHPDLLTSQVLIDINTKWNTFFLPTAFPEGSPTHPSYPAGHATVAGACVTLLKAWFDATGVYAFMYIYEYIFTYESIDI